MFGNHKRRPVYLAYALCPRCRIRPLFVKLVDGWKWCRGCKRPWRERRE